MSEKDDQGAVPARPPADPSEIPIVDHRSSTGGKGHAEEDIAEGNSRTEEASPARTAESAEREKEYVNHLKRLKAEFENYRKRVERDRAGIGLQARADLLLRLLPALDGLRRVALHSTEADDLPAVLAGVRLIAKELTEILAREGLEEVPALGHPFDPLTQEALMVREVDDPDRDQIVLEVLVPGYLFKGILLRPARVVVGKYALAPPAESPPATEPPEPAEDDSGGW